MARYILAAHPDSKQRQPVVLVRNLHSLSEAKRWIASRVVLYNRTGWYGGDFAGWSVHSALPGDKLGAQLATGVCEG